jgi:hypothetical protein
MVLSPEHDPFYQANMYQNFGDLGASIRGALRRACMACRRWCGVVPDRVALGMGGRQTM